MKTIELLEGINDKAIFKSVFFGGLPGAGKSHVISRITDGTISPRIVNTDKSYEFLLDKYGMEASDTAWALLGPASKRINNNMLYQYLNSVLPLFIDGTSANPNATMRRSGIVESIGYDTMMIWVDVDLDTAIRRTKQRKRSVDEGFVKEVYQLAESNKPLYQQRFGDRFIVVDNNDDNFKTMENDVFKIVTNFMSSEITNPIGIRTKEEMIQNGWKYLVPNIYTKEYIEKIVSIWYMK